MIRTIPLLLSLLALSCQISRSKNFNPREEVIGNWLILAPQHILNSEAERKAYGPAQDSIVNLFGLKLISLSDDGKFFQVDSIHAKPGAWTMDSLLLNIKSDGLGFERFAGRFAGVVRDTIMITEFIKLRNEEIKVVWYLKRIHDNEDASELFDISNNWWRKRPEKGESWDEIRSRLMAMLNYYKSYYVLVSKESTYFSPMRVFLPFRYYQHGISLKPLLPEDPFVSIFHNEIDARTAYQMLAAAMKKIDDPFPSGENFVIEYAKYFERLANILEIGDL